MNTKEKTKKQHEFAREMDGLLEYYSTNHLLHELESRLCAAGGAIEVDSMLLHRLPIHTYLKEPLKYVCPREIAGWHVAHDTNCETFFGCPCTCDPDVTVVPFTDESS